MLKSKVISLCDLTGNMVRPWAEAGCECHIFDLQHPTKVEFESTVADGIIFRHHHDVTQPHWMFEEEIAIAFAFPPCTDLAVSGARWFKDKGLKGLINALQVVEECRQVLEATSAPYLIENPISTLSTYWRKPDYKFDPCEYGGYLEPEGDAYTKKTCLWTGGGFVMPPPKPIEPVLGSKMHRLPPSAGRANLRSETPMGFAQAVFEANKHRLSL